jgi:hypothetical protein
MHLSFVTYDRPEEKRVYLRGLEATIAPVQASSWLDAYNLGPNGFAMPCFQHNENLTTSGKKPRSPRSTFSAAGNMAATPGKAKVVQERGQARQLITGRNFRDILEASRPRVLGSSIPSALESILNLNMVANGNESGTKDWSAELTKAERSRKNSTLMEWGTVDFQEFPSGGASMSSRGSSPSPSFLGGSAHNTLSRHNLIENSQSSDDGSTSSRCTDSPVSSQYGTSYDRLFWEYYDPPKVPKKAFHLQRSPSLEFEPFETKAGAESIEGDDSASLGTDAASKSSFGGDSDTNESQKSKVDKRMESIQRFMDKYDAMVCGPLTVADPNIASEKPQWSESVVLGEHFELSSTPKAGPMSFQSGGCVIQDVFSLFFC